MSAALEVSAGLAEECSRLRFPRSSLQCSATFTPTCSSSIWYALKCYVAHRDESPAGDPFVRLQSLERIGRLLNGDFNKCFLPSFVAGLSAATTAAAATAGPAEPEEVPPTSASQTTDSRPAAGEHFRGLFNHAHLCPFLITPQRGRSIRAATVSRRLPETFRSVAERGVASPWTGFSREGCYGCVPPTTLKFQRVELGYCVAKRHDYTMRFTVMVAE